MTDSYFDVWLKVLAVIALNVYLLNASYVMLERYKDYQIVKRIRRQLTAKALGEYAEEKLEINWWHVITVLLVALLVLVAWCLTYVIFFYSP